MATRRCNQPSEAVGGLSVGTLTPRPAREQAVQKKLFKKNRLKETVISTSAGRQEQRDNWGMRLFLQQVFLSGLATSVCALQDATKDEARMREQDLTAGV